ncbi:MAG: holo-ACP synthase [Pirellula sp.]
MQIIAHGIDVVEIDRIHRDINAPGSVWISAVYSAEERGLADSGPLRYRFFAGRFAGKEAIAKALGTGFTGAITWQGIEILRSENGAPRVKLCGDALLQANGLGISNWLISITYSSQLAFASAIALGEPTI